VEQAGKTINFLKWMDKNLIIELAYPFLSSTINVSIPAKIIEIPPSTSAKIVSPPNMDFTRKPSILAANI